MRNNIFLLIFSLFLINSYYVKAQIYFNRVDSIKVHLVNGTELRNPWAGGLNFLQVSDIDLNFDGIMDLFVFDRSGNKISTFINGGTPNTVDYHYDAEYINKFPQLSSWVLLRDYNCDGKMDIFTHTNLGIKIYRNDGDAVNGLKFTLVKPTLYSYYINTTPPTNYLNLYVTSTDIPAIYDVDNDGDIDVLTFDFIGVRMQWNKNYSMELYGTCDSLNYFVLEDECFGDFEENFSNNSVTLDVCGPSDHIAPVNNNNLEDDRSSRHSGSCTLCADLNGDTKRDLVLGDISYNTLVYLENGGTLQMADMISQQTNYPNNTNFVNVPLFPCAFYVDVNNDGKRDLLASPNAGTCSYNDKSLWYYKNINQDDSAYFEFQQMNFLQQDMIEVGEGAYPAFVDFNNDSLMDIIIGNYGYPDDGCVYTSKLTALKNIGTLTEPKFELFSKDFASLGSLGLQNLVPSFGDLDNDGDEDMIIGASDGRLYYYQNVAAAGLPANYVANNSLFAGIIAGQFASPQVIDVNRDGLLDVLVGRSNGKLNYFKNIGTVSAPVFSADSANYFFGGINVTPVNVSSGFSFPCLYNNSNGEYELLVGSSNGVLYRYGNIDNNINGNFTRLDSAFQNIKVGDRVAPALYDINNDQLLDLIIGNYSGGVSFFMGDTINASNTINKLSYHPEINIYPNPANHSIFFKMDDVLRITSLKIEIINIQGQVIYTEVFAPGTLNNISTENLKSGIYFCRVSSRAFITTGKFVVQH
ncbi:MAG: T9SS type A sorting domain-containing protein [Bacteroidia bacterium]|nr:T9SS type A sorting domain-containing protein [Bacteroidia bacterium]MCZ2248344.1 T9SS type A sorting domain-containing protein [Bacteroidia bacterium]